MITFAFMVLTIICAILMTACIADPGKGWDRHAQSLASSIFAVLMTCCAFGVFSR